MRTERQIEASRLNGAKSHGPRTSEGKARSSQNATRHGFLAKTLVLNTESQAAFDELLNIFDDIMKPRDGFEDDLVAIMVASRWRSRRLLAVESSGTDGEIEKVNQPSEPAARTASKAFRNRSDSSVPELIRRLDEGYTRQLIRAYDLLMRYRQDNKLGHGPGLSASAESELETEPTETETNPSAPSQPSPQTPAHSRRKNRPQRTLPLPFRPQIQALLPEQSSPFHPAHSRRSATA